MRRFVGRIGLVVAMVVVSGCGASTTKLSGKVTYKGKPVVWGNVSVVASDNISYAGEIQDDGTFMIPKIPVGPCKIGVTSPNPKGDVIPKPLPKKTIGAKTGSPAASRPLPPPGAWFPIEDVYRDPIKSTLTGEIKKGEPLNVEIK